MRTTGEELKAVQLEGAKVRYKIQINVFEVHEGDESYLFEFANQQEHLPNVVGMAHGVLDALIDNHEADEKIGHVHRWERTLGSGYLACLTCGEVGKTSMETGEVEV